MDIQVHTVKTLDELYQVQSFIYEVYLGMEYCLPNADRKLVHHRNMDLNSIGMLNLNTEVIFIRNRLGTLIGTSSMTCDTDRKLPTDETFPNETDVIRAECRKDRKRLGAVWRLATDDPKPRLGIVGTLIAAMVDWAHSRDIDVCLAAVHPHHVKYYSRFLKMHVLAERDSEVGLTDKAKVVLMRWDWEPLEELKRIKCES